MKHSLWPGDGRRYLNEPLGHMSAAKTGKVIHLSMSLRLGMQDADDEGVSDTARGGDGVAGKEKVEELVTEKETQA